MMSSYDASRRSLAPSELRSTSTCHTLGKLVVAWLLTARCALSGEKAIELLGKYLSSPMLRRCVPSETRQTPARPWAPEPNSVLLSEKMRFQVDSPVLMGTTCNGRPSGR